MQEKRTRKTPNTDTFHAVTFSKLDQISKENFNQISKENFNQHHVIIWLEVIMKIGRL